MMNKYFIFLLLISVLACKKSPQPVVADFVFFPVDDRFTYDTIIFENKSVNAESFRWDFMDTTSSTESSPEHVFRQKKAYNVTLYASNEMYEDSITKRVEIHYWHFSRIMANNVWIQVDSLGNDIEVTWEFELNDSSSDGDGFLTKTYDNGRVTVSDWFISIDGKSFTFSQTFTFNIVEIKNESIIFETSTGNIFLVPK